MDYVSMTLTSVLWGSPLLVNVVDVDKRQMETSMLLFGSCCLLDRSTLLHDKDWAQKRGLQQIRGALIPRLRPSHDREAQLPSALWHHSQRPLPGSLAHPWNPTPWRLLGPRVSSKIFRGDSVRPQVTVGLRVGWTEHRSDRFPLLAFHYASCNLKRGLKYFIQRR
jgi:hypothetical protein